MPQQPSGWSLVQPAARADGWTPVASRPVSAEDFAPTPAAPEGSALSRFASNAGEMLNPIAAAEGIGHAIAHPADTAKALYDASAAQFDKARDMAKQGRYSEAAGHLFGMIPLIGPAAAQAGEQIASGDVAGGLGKGVGLLLPVAGATVARGAIAAAPEGLRASIADSLAAKAGDAVTDVMSPKVGPNKVRLANRAADIAPELLKDGTTDALSRQGMAANVGAKLSEAEQALDAASDARLATRTIPTQPIIADLLAKRAKLTAKAVEGSQPEATVVSRTSPVLDASGNPITVTSQQAQPLGADVVPAPNMSRVGQIDQAINEIKKLGPVARYDDLRTVRAAYDGPAKAVYNPSMTADFLAKKGESLGAADVTGSLRDFLAKMDPETAKANAQYALYKTASDVLDATAETERARPAVGRRLVARMTGSVIGEQAAGVPGAVAGYALGPVVDAMASSGWTTKLKAAQLMNQLAMAVRSGSEGGTASAVAQLRKLAAQAGVQIDRITSPSGSQTPSPAPAR